MTWYYAIGNERQGPIDDAALDRLIATGVVTQDTLVWKAGMADWQPLAKARPRAATPPTPAMPPPPAAITPAPAGITPAPVAGVPDAQPRFGTPTPVVTPTPTATPAPSPAHGAPGGGFGAAGWSQAGAASSNDPDRLYARIVSENRTFAIGDVVGRAWQLVMDNFGVSVLTTAVVWLATAVPCLGTLALPMLLGGLFFFFLKLARGQHAEFGDAFAGFSDSFAQLFLCGLVLIGATLLSLIPGILMCGLAIVSMERSEALGLMLMLIGTLVLILPSIYLCLIWIFSLPLIIDKRMDFWPAMQLSRRVASRMLLPILGLMFVCWLINLGGQLALCVGIFVAMPIVFASLTLAYEDLFGERARA